MKPNELVLDFETANPVVDLPEVGSTVYSKHWATEILCLGYALAHDKRGNEQFLSHPKMWLKNGGDGLLIRMAEDPRVVFIAHNAGFEKDIWRNIMVPKYGFPDVPNRRWHDIMAVAFLRGLPGALERLLLALGLPGKDMAGLELTLSLSKWHRRNKKGGYTKSKRGQWLLPRTPQLMHRVYEYCQKDVADEVGVHELLGYLPPDERAVWEIDQEINERGLMFDLPMVQGAQKIYEAVAPALIEEFRQITGLNPTQNDKIKKWCEAQGIELPNMRKETLTDLLGDEDAGEDSQGVLWERGEERAGILITLPGHIRRALAIRSLIGSSSVTKYARMGKCIDGDTRRIYRLFQYHGAGPGRWAGRLLNPHNMPRGIVRRARAIASGINQGTSAVSTRLETAPGPVSADVRLEAPDAELLAKAITSGRPVETAALGLVKDDRTPAHPIEVLASALRNTVIAAPGKAFLIGDWRNIEARLVLAIAGQRDKIALMVGGHDVYLDMACLIHNVPLGIYTKDDVEPRQKGKNGVLSCGYQISGYTFWLKYCPKEKPVFGYKAVNAYRKTWAPKVPVLWKDLQYAALSAVQNPGRMFGAAGMEYRVEGGWLVGHCPDGSNLYYYRPTLCRQKPRWKEIDEAGNVIDCVSDKWVDAWRYQLTGGHQREDGKGGQRTYRQPGHRGQGLDEPGGGVNNTIAGQWLDAYGGLLTENYIQHMARQILCGALKEAKRQGLDVVLHNQDELVLEVPERLADEKILQQMMEIQPEWLRPYAIDPDGNLLQLIQAECFAPCTRYHK